MRATKYIHHMGCKTKRKDNEITLKIDINKAFDRAQWDYLLRVMDKMRFHMKQIGWMKLCFKIVNYQVKINGNHVGPISPKRGLR